MVKLSEDILEWVINKAQFNKVELVEKFKLDELKIKQILDSLLLEGMIFEAYPECYYVKENTLLLKNANIAERTGFLDEILKGIENKQGCNSEKISWDNLGLIDKFVIFEGAEKIYEIHKQGKIIRLEGKEIMDYNMFRLRFFEQFGVMLSTYKGIAQDWANLVSHWYSNYGEFSADKVESLSDIQEAKEMVIDYVNNSIPVDNHISKEGMICVREGVIYLSIRIVRKILKRNNFNINLRKLAYVLNDYLLSSSIPIKIENKSERFWKLNKEKFTMNKNKIELTEEKDE